MAELLDERTLREGAAILAALERAGFTGDIRQVSAYVDDQRDPTAAEYRIGLRRAGKRFPRVEGSAEDIIALLALVGAA